MGVLVKYQFDNLTEADVVLIGRAIGKLSIDDASDLHGRLQSQIFAQEKIEQDRVTAEQSAAVEAWRSSEREKLKAEMPKRKQTPSRKKGL
jgi:hypothetical protein